MNIATSPTREKYPLSTKKVLKKTIVSLSVWFVILLIILLVVAIPMFGSGYSSTPFLFTMFVLILIFFVIALIIYLYQQWYYNVYYYNLTPDFIVIKKGPITPREITIPYERVQDVYVDQDIFDRIFGLYDVHLSSATISSGMEAHIDGVEKTAADGLRQELLTTVNLKIGKTTPIPTPAPTQP
ncbi:hypothetical protein A2627_04770 [Candidatus Woesebacteria bacterium RIFCSPHIGHO2_01_FULL_39_28]|uniref:YdbS-like PH domain-containing protein n=1 Tax=Candidatus Woesebacteria bacterium RIFCSPHIGHO2_01_FULL_39_28 TaxID=1802496 RepID=A0A1F7YA07_9BACT|nr:MAG: hypothetical protein A2627_04770 [Candidatus Woesebacteria bacterium RIFCSPHIGHO2_01_FULL_39_28]OGM58444.1 MAG: hypothetical protein A3A50_01045 [Candidatus Woesebacteria bacterium RIFCSPLOWO2_01_FULL_38_20]